MRGLQRSRTERNESIDHTRTSKSLLGGAAQGDFFTGK
jgi:hypothetical protein